MYDEMLCTSCWKLFQEDQLIEDEDDEQLYCAACMDEWRKNPHGGGATPITQTNQLTFMPTKNELAAARNSQIIEVILKLLDLAPILVEHGPAFIKHFRQNAELTPEAAADLDKRISEWGTKPHQRVEKK